MTTGAFATLYQIVFLLAGIAGFVPGLSSEHAHPGVAVEGASWLALGLFPVNAVHNIVHLLFGLWASPSRAAKRRRGLTPRLWR